MANYSESENIMLSGQTAYFKKTGTMANLGVIEIPNALSAYSYSDGYIAANSVVHGTDLANTSEYIECENEMKWYMGEHWIENTEERSIIANSNVIKTLLGPASNTIQNIVNSIV